jgi:chromosome segregation ATPase
VETLLRELEQLEERRRVLIERRAQLSTTSSSTSSSSSSVATTGTSPTPSSSQSSSIKRKISSLEDSELLEPHELDRRIEEIAAQSKVLSKTRVPVARGELRRSEAALGETLGSLERELARLSLLNAQMTCPMCRLPIRF